MLAALRYIHGNQDLALEFRCCWEKAHLIHACTHRIDMAGVQDTGEVILVCASRLEALEK